MWAYLGQTYAIDKNVLFKYMGANFTDLLKSVFQESEGLLYGPVIAD